MASQQLERDVAEFRLHFEEIYLRGMPRLLDEDGMFLGFLVFLTGIEALAGAFASRAKPGERFRAFVARFFSGGLEGKAADLWRARNLMVHSFNPGPFGLVSGQPQIHLKMHGQVVVLNAQDTFAALVAASTAYFEALAREPDLLRNFAYRLTDADGGGIETHIMHRGGGA